MAPPTPEPIDINATIRPARGQERRGSLQQQSDIFSMSPEPAEAAKVDDNGPGQTPAGSETSANGEILTTREIRPTANPTGYFSFTSSPEPLQVPTVPSTRRSSAVGSIFNGAIPLTRFPTSASQASEVTGLSESFYSETSAAPFADYDRKLEQLVIDNEPDAPVKVPAGEIPTEVPEALKNTPYAFDCAFGWTGDEETDLEDIPKTKAAFLAKLGEAKEGTTFISNALINYQTEINSRRHHKFFQGFLQHQNNAIVVTNEQLDSISDQLDIVMTEVKAISDDDAEIDHKLLEAYQHAVPWIKRTKRVLFDQHVFYKLNYAFNTKTKSVSKKKSDAVKKEDSVSSNSSTRALYDWVG